MTEPTKPTALTPFIGTWQTTGATRATASEPSQQIEAVDSYEWLQGGYFILHHIESKKPMAFKGLEIIGRDESGNYFLHHYDSMGGRVVSKGEMSGRCWHITSQSERFTGTISEDGRTITGSWDRSNDGKAWTPWMDITLRKSA